MKIGIVGINGRIGKILSTLIAKEELSGGISSATSPRELENVISESDVLIDFSAPAALHRIIDVAAQYKTPIVSGTTDFSDKDFERIREISRIIPILHSSNFSLGVQLMAILVRKCAQILPDFDFGIIERHHNRKKDAPSGTALFLAQQISKEAQIVSLREGNIFGEHICDFVGEHEMISICHRAFDREVFASGAIKCARWLVGKHPKLYSMQDYLNSVGSI
ncbi:MAG: 4-hydroxy-tetrahydrodipicolinate reductase [Holosporaceae bacterium]|jgi:4-hydroxy-tetrahydrodipicolinate reductase|nr:4-hydroxy-tetrahydrodipicolinate reductase [Holosporaceae bacterium]